MTIIVASNDNMPFVYRSVSNRLGLCVSLYTETFIILLERIFKFGHRSRRWINYAKKLKLNIEINLAWSLRPGSKAVWRFS